MFTKTSLSPFSPLSFVALAGILLGVSSASTRPSAAPSHALTPPGASAFMLRGADGWDPLPLAERLGKQMLAGLSRGNDPCTLWTDIMAQANVHDAHEELGIQVAKCVNLIGPGRPACIQEAWQDFLDTLDEIAEVYQARLDLCQALGGGTYDPDVIPSMFVDGIDNPYLPYQVGNTWTYEAMTEEGLEIIVVTVTDQTREIEGIECIVVRDTVTLNGVLLEDTAAVGGVFLALAGLHLGEVSRNYDQEGFLEDLDGSWLTGVEGAKPGIVMHANPIVGTTYRQEFLIDDAEDAATILSDNASASTIAGNYTNCVQTEDFTPLEPDGIEHKYYAPGIGLVLEIKPDDGERLDLVSFTPGT